MLDKPDLEDARLQSLLRDVYGLNTEELVFLPLGADPDTAVYRAVTPDGAAYFVKLRRGAFDALSLRLPRHLRAHGVAHLVPVVATTTGALWAGLDNGVGLEPYTVIVYPFIEGKSGYEAPFTAQHWREFGAALRRLHTLKPPPGLYSGLRREAYGAGARERARAFLSGLDAAEAADALQAQLFALMREHRAGVAELVSRAERCAQTLQDRSVPFVVCHADLHAGNVLIGESGFHIVDWDDPILAPKERDLMYVGGAQGFIGHTPEEEERFFYEGYGPTRVDPVALAYYRLERVIQDVAIFCDDITCGTLSEAEREQSLRYLAGNFRPGGTVERALDVEIG